MSLELYVGDGEATETEDCDYHHLGSASGVAEFSRWAETLGPDGFADVHHFADQGWAINIGRLREQVERGLESNPPTPDVASTARHLISLLKDRPEDYVAIIEG
jgi:hypothetical protein